MRHRQKPTPERAAELAAARAYHDKRAMTCQICERKILAETGVIAHHGYERPEGWNQQTASCMGARELPFEADRTVLGRMIDGLKNAIELEEQNIAKLTNETKEIVRIYSDYSQPRTRWGYPQNCVSFTRATFEQVRDDNPAAFRHTGSYPFDHFKTQAIDACVHRAAQMQHALDRATRRFEAWKQTHLWQKSKPTHAIGEPIVYVWAKKGK